MPCSPSIRQREDQITCFIGSKKSKLLIRDTRQEPVLAAHHDPSGIKGPEFAVAFNQPAYAEVSVAGQEGNLKRLRSTCALPNKAMTVRFSGWESRTTR